MSNRPTSYEVTGLDTETRETLSSMLGISYYTDAMIARHTGLSETFVAGVRKKRGGKRAPFPTYKGFKKEQDGGSGDMWIKQARSDTDALAAAIIRAAEAKAA
jgi:hypothetical protein